MKTFAAMAIISLLLFSPTYAQIRDSGNVAVKSIRRVAKARSFNNKPVIEIELVWSFYTGGLYYCLRSGKLQGIPEGGTLEGGEPSHDPFSPPTRVFVLTEQDWKRLRNGDPLWLSWGCLPPSGYEAMEPFAYLNKKVLSKK